VGSATGAGGTGAGFGFLTGAGGSTVGATFVSGGAAAASLSALDVAPLDWTRRWMASTRWRGPPRLARIRARTRHSAPTAALRGAIGPDPLVLGLGRLVPSGPAS